MKNQDKPAASQYGKFDANSKGLTKLEKAAMLLIVEHRKIKPTATAKEIAADAVADAQALYAEIDKVYAGEW